VSKERNSPGWLLFLYVIVFGIVLIHAFSYFQETNEDAWISFKYAVNLSEGHGLVSNRGGVPQEGYSNFILVLLLALFKKIFGFDVVFISKAIGITSILGAISINYFILKLFFHKISNALKGEDNLSYFYRYKELYFHFINIGLILGIAFSNYFNLWAIQGLETILYSFVVGSVLCALIYALIEKKPHYLYLATVLSFVSMNTRPEGIMNFFLVIGLCLIYFILEKKIDPIVTRSLIISILLYSSMVAALFIFKYLYFGDIIANPTHIKLALSVWSLRWPYILQYFSNKGFLFSFTILLSLLLSVIYGLQVVFKKTIAGFVDPYFIIIGIAVFIFSQFFYAWYSGGDYMPHSRFIVTHYPLFILLSYLVLIYSIALFKMDQLGIVVLFLIALIFCQSAYGEPVTDKKWWQIGFVSPLSVQNDTVYGRTVSKVKKIMEKHENDYYATSEFGYIPYHLINLKGLDMMGLNQKEVARNYKIYPLNEAFYASRDYILSKKPFIIFVGSFFYDKKQKEMVFYPGVAWFFKQYYESEYFLKNYEGNIPIDGCIVNSFTFLKWNNRYRSANKIYWNDLTNRDKLMYGFHVKEGKVWIGPLARVLIKPKKGDKNIILEGKLPPSKYDENRSLILELRSNEKAVGDLLIGRIIIDNSDDFKAKFLLPENILKENEDILLTLTAKQRISDENDQETRSASYIFKSIYFSGQ